MDARRGDERRRRALAALLLALWACVAAGCGSSGTTPEAPVAGTTPSSPAPSATPTAIAAHRPNLPSAEVVAVLEGRIAAMNEGDGAAAAAFYTTDGVLEETDLRPHLVSRGRDEIATRFDDLYGMGLRLAPAGAPIACGSFVAEPTRFSNGNAPGRGAAMLVFEIAAGNKLAYQWMIGWAGGPEETFAIVKSPSVDRHNIPPRRVMRILRARMAATNRGDARAAAYYAEDARLEMSEHPGEVIRGRTAIAEHLRGLHLAGLRLAPAGSPITYDAYVAEPVYFVGPEGTGRSAGMLVTQFDPAYKIVGEWVIGGVNEATGPGAAQAPTAVDPNPGGGIGEIAFTRGTLTGSGSGDLIEAHGIYLVGTDGTGLRRLVEDTDARNPAWSPDGSRIAYFDGAGVNVIDADGSGKRFVTRAKAWGGWAGWLTWSPDGTRIAFTSYTGDHSDLYVVAADGSGRRQLTTVAAKTSVGHPSWAPDGRIFFDVRSADASRTRIWSVNADGTGRAAVRDVPGAGSFSLSADGKWLLVWEANGLVRVPAKHPRPAEESLVIFGITQRIKPECFFALASAWSPEGDRIVFAADQQAWISPSALWIVDADGRHLRKIPKAGVGWDPVWRPE